MITKTITAFPMAVRNQMIWWEWIFSGGHEMERTLSDLGMSPETISRKLSKKYRRLYHLH